MPPARKRPNPSTSPTPASKSARRSISIGSSRIKDDPDAVPSANLGTSASANYQDRIKSELLAMFEHPSAAMNGVSNTALKKKFGNSVYIELVPVINELMKSARLKMSREGEELFYSLVSEDVASKLKGLDVNARMVYQVIEKAGNMGIWTRDIRVKTSIQQQALNKIFKNLEARKIIKPVKAVTSKSKKLYMLYDLTPAKELTGGPWYTELEFDHEFIAELRKFILLCVRKMNGGRGVTLAEISDKMKQAKVSRIPLDLDEVQQVMQTLAFDFMIEQTAVNQRGEALFIPGRKVTTMCDFKWWDVLAADFHFRKIRFEDGVTLGPHEPHHHS